MLKCYARIAVILAIGFTGSLCVVFSGIAAIQGRPIPGELTSIAYVCVGLLGGWLSHNILESDQEKPNTKT